MDKTMDSPKILLAAAIFGQFLALLPFAVAFCGLGIKRYEPWVYFAVYAVWAVFYAAGFFCGRLAHELELSGKPSRKAQPAVMFISRAAVLVPVALFIAVIIITKISGMALFYVLPGGIIAFFGAHGSEGNGYTDKFSRGWFALYFVSGLIAAMLLWSSHEEKLAADGISQICDNDHAVRAARQSDQYRPLHKAASGRKVGAPVWSAAVQCRIDKRHLLCDYRAVSVRQAPGRTYQAVYRDDNTRFSRRYGGA